MSRVPLRSTFWRFALIVCLSIAAPGLRPSAQSSPGSGLCASTRVTPEESADAHHVR